MAMITRQSRKTSSNLLEHEKACPFVIPENEIRDYVETLGIHDTGAAAIRFQIVADLTKREPDRLDHSDLRLIKQIAGQDGNKLYRRIMRAIITAIGKDSQGINAAHLTSSLAVQMIFRWSPEYFSALSAYRDKLRMRRRS